MQKGFAPIIILIGILVLASVGGAYYFYRIKTPTQKACTMDAKICPDGSSVGRVSPNCEFSLCPKSSPSPTPDETANWKTYTNTKYAFSVKYPSHFNTNEQTSDTFPLLVSFEESPTNMFNGFTVEVRERGIGEEGLEGEVAYRKSRIIGHVADNIQRELGITKNGYKGVSLEYEITSANKKYLFVTTIISTTKYLYVINTSKENFDQIFATFEFLN